MRTQKQSIFWRSYAVVMMLIVGVSHLSYLLQGRPLSGWLGTLSILLSIVAVNVWAFGFRTGSPIFWRLYAAAFVPYTFWALSGVALNVVRVDTNAESWPIIAANISSLIAFALLCVALIKMAQKRRHLHTPAADTVEPVSTARLAAIKRAHSNH